MAMTRARGFVHYPHSDGKPMVESPQHLEAMIYLIDIAREYLSEPVILHRLVGREYQQVPNERPNDREWWVTSDQLGLRIMVRAEEHGYLVRLWDPVRQVFLPSIREVMQEVLRLYAQLEEAR
ncbi:MAG: hypothetical protein KatS3mg022_3034 [Armatimonadota bacterium]|nr:MAG: hypothetical protein KatS3mg022_3034 [Armatimonadota bacterium]